MRKINLILERGKHRIAIECKSSSAPEVGKGLWNALDDLNIREAVIIAPVKKSYPIAKGVMVMALDEFELP